MGTPDYTKFKLVLKKAIILHFEALAKTLAGDRCNG